MSNVKPIPLAPPFNSSAYVSPLSHNNPMSCSIPLNVDTLTGILSGTPDKIGRYLVALSCKEWRGGKLINISRREFEIAVAASLPPYKPYAGNDTTIYAGDTVQFNAIAAATYSWAPGTYLSSTTIPNPVGRFPVTGVFNYVLTGVNDSGCVGSDTMKVTVIGHAEFAAPNAFTPNGDGSNDRFALIPVKNSTLVSIKIYNSQWHLIYTGNAQNPSWDGTYNGAKQPAGAYFWQAVYKDNHDVTQTQNGAVTLIR
jgi:gliding motility-associated-like protein